MKTFKKVSFQIVKLVGLRLLFIYSPALFFGFLIGEILVKTLRGGH